MTRTITLDVVQGVGDIYWIYQKVSPYFDIINLNILCVSQTVIQKRALGFVELLPKIGTITYKQTTAAQYDAVAHTTHKIAPILDNPTILHSYAVNWPLEHGTRLEDIDPGTEVEWEPKFVVSPMRVFEQPYQVLYISGSKGVRTWTTGQWMKLVEHVFSTKLPIVLLGAKYDAAKLLDIKRWMHRKFEFIPQIDNDPQQAIRLLRDAELFVGYQSGLNIIADAYNTRQIMLYFPYLRPMLNTWCKPGHAESGLFNAFTFDQTPLTIAQTYAKQTR